jgi:hypothetical protein
MAAVMAQQDAPEPVFHQRGRAIGAFDTVTASAAQGQRRIAAAVEEEQRLLPIRQGGFDGRSQRLGDPSAGFGRCFAHVDDIDFRQTGPSDPVAQNDAPIPSPVDIDQGFKRWRRRGEDDRESAEHPIDDRHVPRMIRDALLLLEGTLVLFIDNDELKLLPWQEQR